MPYDWEKSEAYVFGQGCTCTYMYWVKKEHGVSIEVAESGSGGPLGR